MSRLNFNRRAGWVLVPTFVFLTASGLFGAVLLEDDFTDPAASHLKWLKSDDLTATVSGGSCQLSNTGGSVGDYLYTFNGTKPATFTITYTLISQTGAANKSGVLFCKQPNLYSGYFLTVDGDALAVYSMAQSGNNVAWEPIYRKQSVDVNPSNNEITVSKSGSRIVLLANGEYVGEFTSNTYASGDFALFLSENITATFGPVRVTDEFTDKGPKTAFSDNFNSGRSKYWNYLKNGEPEIGDASGVLSIKTGANVSSWMYINMSFTEFTASVDVRHVSGGTTINDMYGILLLGDPPSGGGDIPMVYFAISGGRKYSIWNGGESRPDPVLSNAIMGSPGNLTVEFVDTLEVSRKFGAAAYEFAVNGQVLSADYPVVDFPITGVGVFSFSKTEMSVAFDNFEATNDGTSSIKFTRNPNITRGGKNAAAKSVNSFFYDLRGRKRYAANHQAAGRGQLRAAGVYVNQNGREVLTDRNKRKR